MINLNERMLPTSAGVEPATSWSPVGRRIPLSHRGRLIYVVETSLYSVVKCLYVVLFLLYAVVSITKTCLFKYTEIFTNKKWKCSDKNSDMFHISAQNIDCGYSLEPPRRGGSNEYPQSMFLSRSKKNYVYPCKPQFYYRKMWGLRGLTLYRHLFVMQCYMLWFCFSLYAMV